MKLSPKQTRFVKEYVVDLNGTKAAIRAGYSEKTARHQATRLLSKAHIQAAITDEQAKLTRKIEVTAERVVAEYAKIAFSDIRDIAFWTREVVLAKKSDELPPEVGAAVAEVSVTAKGVKVKMHDKKGALDSLSRHLGLFHDKLEASVTGDITLANLVKAADDGNG